MTSSSPPTSTSFQFTSTDAGVTAVPNSDSDFAAGYAEGKVLMSKRANADYYSKMMAAKGRLHGRSGCKLRRHPELCRRQDHLRAGGCGRQGAEAVDAVSGATLVDTAGYLSAIVDAA